MKTCNFELTAIPKSVKLISESTERILSSNLNNIPHPNSYPHSDNIGIGSNPDCFVTSLNKKNERENPMPSLKQLYEKTAYTPNEPVPSLKEADSGDAALLKMLPFIPPEYRHLLLWESNVEQMLFRARHQQVRDSGKIRALVVLRISTADGLQDPLSAISQMMELVDIQEYDPNFSVVGVCLDFFKRGYITRGRLIFDKVINQLWENDSKGLELIPNAISSPEISRLSRRMSVIFDVAENCNFFHLQLLERNNPLNLALLENAGTLAEKAAKAQVEPTQMGNRISNFKRGTLKRFRAIPGIETFAFKVETTKDSFGRTTNAVWVKKPEGYAILQFLIEQVLVTPSVNHLSKLVKEKYGRKLSPGAIRNLLLDAKNLGLLRRPYRTRVLNPREETFSYRDHPLPHDLENDFRQVDKPPFQVFAPEIATMNPDTYLKIRERLLQKDARQRPTPYCRRRGHRPSRESGHQVLSGMVECRVGTCREPYVLAGPSGTDLMACQGRTKKKGDSRCTQSHYLHGEDLQQALFQMAEEFLTEVFPEFCSMYKEEAKREIARIAAERDAFAESRSRHEDYIKEVVKGSERFGSTSRVKLDALINSDFDKAEKLERMVRERTMLLKYVEENLSLDDVSIQRWINRLKELFQKNPREANEAFRQIVDRFEIRSVELLNDSSKPNSGAEKRKTTSGVLLIGGAVVVKSARLAGLVKSNPPLENFLLPELSTKVPGNIILSTSVEGEIALNFEILASTGCSRTCSEEKRSRDFCWRFIGSDQIDAAVANTFSKMDCRLDLAPTTVLDGGRLSWLGISINGFVNPSSQSPLQSLLDPVFPSSAQRVEKPATVAAVPTPASLKLKIMPDVQLLNVPSNGGTRTASLNALETPRKRGLRRKVRVITPNDPEYWKVAVRTPRITSFSLFDEE